MSDQGLPRDFVPLDTASFDLGMLYKCIYIYIYTVYIYIYIYLSICHGLLWVAMSSCGPSKSSLANM